MIRSVLALVSLTIVVAVSVVAVRLWPSSADTSQESFRRSAGLASYFETVVADAAETTVNAIEIPPADADVDSARVLRTPPPSMEDVIAALGMPDIESQRYGRSGLVPFYRWLVRVPGGEVRLMREDDRVAPLLTISEAGPSRRRTRVICGYATKLEAEVDAEDRLLTMTLWVDGSPREVLGREAEDWRYRNESLPMPRSGLAGLDAVRSPCASGR